MVNEYTANGVTVYTHVAWANDTNGGDFSLVEFDGARFMGNIVNESAAEITDFKQYEWNPIEGSQDALLVANNTNQYFWVTETGTDTGAHITETPQNEFLKDPENGGGNLLARSNGIAVRDGMTELAAFTGDSVRVGEAEQAHFEVTPTTARFYDGEEILVSINPHTNDAGLQSPTVVLLDDHAGDFRGAVYTNQARISGADAMSTVVRADYRDGEDPTHSRVSMFATRGVGDSADSSELMVYASGHIYHLVNRTRVAYARPDGSIFSDGSMNAAGGFNTNGWPYVGINTWSISGVSITSGTPGTRSSGNTMALSESQAAAYEIIGVSVAEVSAPARMFVIASVKDEKTIEYDIYRAQTAAASGMSFKLKVLMRAKTS